MRKLTYRKKIINFSEGDSRGFISVYQDQAIYGCITIVLLTGIVMVGMEWEAKAQIVLLVVLLAAIADFCVGALVGPKSEQEVAQGFVGFNCKWEL